MVVVTGRKALIHEYRGCEGEGLPGQPGKKLTGGVAESRWYPFLLCRYSFCFFLLQQRVCASVTVLVEPLKATMNEKTLNSTW